MHDGVDGVLSEKRADGSAIADLADDQRGIEHCPAKPPRQVIEHHHALAARAQLQHHVAADVARTAGD